MSLVLYDELTPEQVAHWAGAMRHSPGWLNYSLKNARSVDRAIRQVQEAQGIRLKISHINNDPVAAHWLKLMNYKEGYAWDDGFVFMRYRGRQHGLLADDWKLFHRWATRQGYPDILCASFFTNTLAHTWITQVCDFYEVGIRTKGSPRASDGKFATVRIYASKGQSLKKARKRAEKVYTKGKWC